MVAFFVHSHFGQNPGQFKVWEIRPQKYRVALVGVSFVFELPEVEALGARLTRDFQVLRLETPPGDGTSTP